jgi:hypothetical protein
MTDTKEIPTRPDVEGAHDLAHDCVTMTLHGPLPLPTSMKLAEHVLALHAWVAHLERRSPELTEDDRKAAERLFPDGPSPTHEWICIQQARRTDYAAGRASMRTPEPELPMGWEWDSWHPCKASRAIEPSGVENLCLVDGHGMVATGFVPTAVVLAVLHRAGLLPETPTPDEARDLPEDCHRCHECPNPRPTVEMPCHPVEECNEDGDPCLPASTARATPWQDFDDLGLAALGKTPDDG